MRSVASLESFTRWKGDTESVLSDLFDASSWQRRDFKNMVSGVAFLLKSDGRTLDSFTDQCWKLRVLLASMRDEIRRFTVPADQTAPVQAQVAQPSAHLAISDAGRMSNNDGARPRVFVASSTEALSVAKVIQLNLDRVAEVELWTQGAFQPSSGTLGSLVGRAREVDFSVLVLTPDDIREKRSTRVASPRDNVVFELGLFMGSLGPERVFVVHSREHTLDLPSDLAGITPVTYGRHSNQNLRATLGAPCTEIELVMLRLGRRRRD